MTADLKCPARAMLVVDPRSVMRAKLVKYGDVAAAYLSVGPGVTGPWQVSGRGEVSHIARVMQDADYIAGRNLASDALIIAQTALVPFKMSGR